jgi:hypothetical protein
MSDREEVYRAGSEARRDFAHRATRGSRAGTDAMTRLVNAAFYRYEHEKQTEAAEEPESTEDGDATSRTDG